MTYAKRLRGLKKLLIVMLMSNARICKVFKRGNKYTKATNYSKCNGYSGSLSGLL